MRFLPALLLSALSLSAQQPRVLIIGDSISMGYTKPVQALLANIADVQRIPENGGPTINGLAHMDQWLAAGKWDVIHFNFGLHDLKIMPDGKHQVEVEQYANNLNVIVQRLKGTGAKLIWATTTPVPEGKLEPLRHSGDASIYNAAAFPVMEANHVAIDDLYSFALPRLAEIQQPANVHYTEPGYEALAKQVAASIQESLKKAVTQ
jgi:lysophospholipase L1-like esterase